MVDVSVVVPAYREERLGDTVEELKGVLEGRGIEIIIVTDHPDDPTTGEAEALATGPVGHVSLAEPVGKGGAVLEGFERAAGEVVGFVDADGSISPADVPTLVDKARETGGAIASRNLPGAEVRRNRSTDRRLASRAFNLYVRALFGLPFSDTQCGSKFFRKEAIRGVLPDMRCTGFEFDVELLWRLRARGVEVVEVPVTWSHSEETTFSLYEGPEMLWNLLSLRVRY